MGEPIPEPSTPLPATFGKYLLTDLIAVGGMAEVYKAKIFGASGFEKDMVVKRVHPKHASNPAFIDMLVDEAKIAVRLTHGNIVPIYELGEVEDSYYIAMEYVDGATVLDVLRAAHSQRSYLPWAHALYIGAEIAAGLAHAHSRLDDAGQPIGLVHRDVNPRNIVVTKHGEVKILDFGIAQAKNRKSHTQHGVIKGTPGYMSPEQMYGQPVDGRSDLYCAAILVHELLTLRRLFPVWTVKEMRKQFEANPVEPPSTYRPDLPSYVDKVMMRALTTSVVDRFQDAADFEEALRTCVAKSGEPVTSRILARRLAPLVDEDEIAPPDKPTAPSAVAPGAAKVDISKNKEMSALDEETFSDDQHSFEMSREADLPTRTAPLPTRAGSAKEPTRTQVLVQNTGLDWSQSVGSDAEAALASRETPSPVPTATETSLSRRTVLVGSAAGGAALGVGILAGYLGFSRRQVEEKNEPAPVLGTVVIRSEPSGVQVRWDGQVRGVTPLEFSDVDVSKTYPLILGDERKDGLQRTVSSADFKEQAGRLVFELEHRFEAPAKKRPPAKPSSGRSKRRRSKKRRKR